MGQAEVRIREQQDVAVRIDCRVGHERAGTRDEVADGPLLIRDIPVNAARRATVLREDGPGVGSPQVRDGGGRQSRTRGAVWIQEFHQHRRTVVHKVADR